MTRDGGRCLVRERRAPVGDGIRQSEQHQRSADFSGGRNSVHFWEVGSMVRVWSKEEQVVNRDRFWSMVGSGVSVTAACEDLGVTRRTGPRWILATRGLAPVRPPVVVGAVSVG